MRLILYGSFLILCCALIHFSLADNKYYKKSKHNGEYSGDKKYKTKYRTYYGDDKLEDYEVRKHNGKRSRNEDLDFSREKKHQKYTKQANKFIESEEEPLDFKRNQKNYPGKREKVFIPEDDVVEFLSEAKQKFGRDGRGEPKTIRRKNGDSSAEKVSKNKKYKEREIVADEDDDDDEDSEEEVPKVKFEKKPPKTSKRDFEDSEEEVEEEAPKKFRRKIRVRIPDSEEDDSDESDEDEDRRTCGGKGRKACSSNDGSGETSDKPVKSKKIKYSIKFAHEKERTVPTEDDNIMMKIHRSDQKKYKYENDDDEDSSEEHTHPKRLHYLDDDED